MKTEDPEEFLHQIPISTAFFEVSIFGFAEELAVIVRSGAVAFPEETSQIIAVAEPVGDGDLFDGFVGVFEHFPASFQSEHDAVSDRGNADCFLEFMREAGDAHAAFPGGLFNGKMLFRMGFHGGNGVEQLFGQETRRIFQTAEFAVEDDEQQFQKSDPDRQLLAGIGAVKRLG